MTTDVIDLESSLSSTKDPYINNIYVIYKIKNL